MRQTQPAVGQNFLAGMAGGVQAGQQMRQAHDQNALSTLLAGADLNDPALASQVAQYDTGMAMQMNQQNYQRAQAAEQRSYQRDRQARADARAEQEFAMRVQQHTLDMGAAEASQEAAQIEKGLVPGIAAYEAGDIQGLNMIFAENGLQPVRSLEEALPTLMQYDTIRSVLKDVQQMNQPAKPQSGPGKVQADINAGILPQGTDLRSPSTVVNTGNQNPMPGLGKLPGGQTYLYNQDGTVQTDERGVPRIVNLETPEEKQAATNASRVKAEGDANRATVVRDATAKIRERVNSSGFFDLPEVGIIGSRLANAGLNQEAVDVAADIETLKGMVVFDRLEKLREASTNGSSGLGQVTNVEIGLLGAQLGALRQDMSPDAILRTLDTLDRVFGKMSPEAQAYLMGEGGDDFVDGSQGQDALGGRSPSRPATPDFSQMTDDELDEYIANPGGRK